MAPTSQERKQRALKSLISKTKSRSKQKRTRGHIKRYLKSTEAKIEETNARKTLFLKGIKCSQILFELLRDLKTMQSPNAKLFTRNNEIFPFEDTGSISLEFLCTKNDCSLFVMASTNKKKPNNLVFGRTFNHHILDLYELAVIRYRSLKHYKYTAKKALESKPMMIFLGHVWHLDTQYERLRNYFIDFFKGEPIDKIVLNGLDHVISFSAIEVEERIIIYMRTYHVKLKKDPKTNEPAPFLTNCGPDLDFSIRRTQLPSASLWKAALRQPKELQPKKVKNKSTNVFGETIGRLHLQKQDLDKMQGKRSKALRIAGKMEADKNKMLIEQDLEKEKDEIDQENQQIYGFKL